MKPDAVAIEGGFLLGERQVGAESWGKVRGVACLRRPRRGFRWPSMRPLKIKSSVVG